MSEMDELTSLTEIEKAELLDAARNGMLTPHGVNRLRSLMLELDNAAAEITRLRERLAIATEALEGMRYRAACECGEEARKALDQMKGGE